MSNILNRVKKLEDKHYKAPNKVALWAVKEVRLALKANVRPLYKEFKPSEPSIRTEMDMAAKLTRDYGSHEEYLNAVAHLGETIKRIMGSLDGKFVKKASGKFREKTDNQ